MTRELRHSKEIQYAGTPVRRYAGTPVRRYAGTLVRQYAGTPVRRYAGMPVRRPPSLAPSLPLSPLSQHYFFYLY
jgi:hypothetical protein